jgi:hypothetical protein
VEEEREGFHPTSVPRELDDAGEGSTDPLKPPPPPRDLLDAEGEGLMVHTLLVISGILFVLWIVGLAGSWTASTAWTLFVVAAVLFLIWLIATSVGGRRRIVT